MTSSAKPTDQRRIRRIGLAAVAGLFVLGAGIVLVVNEMRTGPSVLFLWMAWLAILLCGYYLWISALAAANDAGSDEQFFRPAGRREELHAEKRALLKALKEIEFDREMGKMSDADAREVSRLYRARAIEIIKTLESLGEAGEAGEVVPVGDVIERELRARFAVAGVRPKQAGAGTEGTGKTAPDGLGEEPAAEASRAQPHGGDDDGGDDDGGDDDRGDDDDGARVAAEVEHAGGAADDAEEPRSEAAASEAKA